MAVVLAYNLSTWQPKAEGLPKVQGQHEIHSAVQADLELKLIIPHILAEN